MTTYSTPRRTDMNTRHRVRPCGWTNDDEGGAEAEAEAEEQQPRVRRLPVCAAATHSCGEALTSRV